jgi:hypothetical protein
MKTQEEIQQRLDDALLQSEDLKEWHDKAYQKYQDDRKWWGKDADRGEMDYVSDLQSGLYSEIKLLKWVLNENTTN